MSPHLPAYCITIQLSSLHFTTKLFHFVPIVSRKFVYDKLVLMLYPDIVQYCENDPPQKRQEFLKQENKNFATSERSQVTKDAASTDAWNGFLITPYSTSDVIPSALVETFSIQDEVKPPALSSHLSLECV